MQKSRAVLAVEAALVLPIVLFVTLAFCYLFQVMEFQLKLQSALNRTAEQTASYGYLLGRVLSVTEHKAEELLEKTELFSNQGLVLPDDTGEQIIRLLGSEPAEKALKQLAAQYMEIQDVRMLRPAGGWEGISFEGSSIRDEERCVVVVAEYRIRIPFVPEPFWEMDFCQTAVCRLFCGDRDYVPEEKGNETEEGEQKYYVTPNGSVYHIRRNCRYLEISVFRTDREGIAGKRNLSGGKYYPCKLCAEGAETTEVLYYTKNGSSYHISKNCSSISRVVIQKSKEELAGMPPCSVCGQEE